MSLIFPGMDPYLEDPDFWPGVHSTFLVYLRDYLRPLLRPRYVAAVVERVYLEGPDRDIQPDVWVRRADFEPLAPEAGSGAVALAVAEDEEPVIVRGPRPREEIHESYVAILDLRSNQKVVTVIELVSPTNKYAGPGRLSYKDKQAEVLASGAHLVEIDLLRTGPHVLAVPQPLARAKARYDYLICVNRARDARNTYELYPRVLRQRLPRIKIPLAEGDPDVRLDLQAVLARTHEEGDYRERIDYTRPCTPPLPPEDQAWADELIRAARA